MTITLNGTTGIVGPNGTASAPAMTGTDTDTGIVYGTNTVQVSTGGTTAVTVDSSQNVGIGTTSPVTLKSATTLQVNGNLKLGNANDRGLISLGDTSSTGANAGIWRGAAGAYGSAGNYLCLGGYDGITFTTGNADIASQTERMRIDSSGRVYSGSSSPWAVGSGGGNAWALYSGGDFPFSAVSQSTITGIFNRCTTTGIIIELKYNAGVVGSISTNGSTVAYNTSSDYRLKENIAPMTGALAKVQALKPVTYKWKSDGSQGQGFIAHELQAVVPDCVTGEKDAVDAEGKPVYQGIDTSFLVATLTAAIQELKAELDTVKTELATLKGTANGVA